MTTEEKLTALRLLSGEHDADVLSVYLALAGKKVIERCYPFRNDVTEVPAKYESAQLEIACYLINKRGAEGETTHNENGISRTYESASIPKSMLRNIIPFAKTF